MAEQLQPIDLNTRPDLLRLIDEVASSRTPRRLQRDGEDIAVLNPVPRRRRTRKGQPTSADDPIWGIIGMAHTEGVGDVSEHVDTYLADAYADTHE